MISCLSRHTSGDWSILAASHVPESNPASVAFHMLLVGQNRL